MNDELREILQKKTRSGTLLMRLPDGTLRIYRRGENPASDGVLIRFPPGEVQELIEFIAETDLAPPAPSG